MPTTTFPEIVNGLFLRSIVLKCGQNLKFVALPVSGIIGGTQKISALSIRPRSLLSKILMVFFCSDGPSDPVNVPVKFEVRSFTRS